MRRSLITATVVLAVLLAGFSVTAQAGHPTRPHEPPKLGRYTGTDSQGNEVSFLFTGTLVQHFRVGDVHMGTAHVSHGGWASTCGTHCFNGSWISGTRVHGSWRHAGSSHHFGWHANLQHVSGGVTH